MSEAITAVFGGGWPGEKSTVAKYMMELGFRDLSRREEAQEVRIYLRDMPADLADISKEQRGPGNDPEGKFDGFFRIHRATSRGLVLHYSIPTRHGSVREGLFFVPQSNIAAMSATPRALVI